MGHRSVPTRPPRRKPLDADPRSERERGATQLILEVRSDNEVAIRLYERLGFERISIRRDYYAPGVDAHIMRLRPLSSHPLPSDNDA